MKTVREQSRGFGFLKFCESISAELALAAGPHQIDGRRIDLVPVVPLHLQQAKLLNGGGMSPQQQQQHQQQQQQQQQQQSAMQASCLAGSMPSLSFADIAPPLPRSNDCFEPTAANFDQQQHHQQQGLTSTEQLANNYFANQSNRARLAASSGDLNNLASQHGPNNNCKMM